MREPASPLKIADPLPPPTIGRLCRFFSLLTVGGGVSVLAGWVLDIARLKTFLPGLATMKANTALSFILSGAALLLLRAESGVPRSFARTLFGRLAATLTGLIGLATLLQYTTGSDFGIDEWLITVTRTPGDIWPARMSAITAFNFVLTSLALLLLDVTRTSLKRPTHWLALAVASNSFLAVIGYLYGADSLYRSVLFSTVAAHTALLFLAVCAALVTARPNSHFIDQIAGAHTAGLINRRLLPAALVIPPLLGWVRWQGELAGYYSTAFGLALFASGNVAVFTSIAWWSARSIHRLSEQGKQVSKISAWQQAILDSADFTVISTDSTGTIQTVNAVAERKLGYAAAELVGRTTPEIIHDRAEVADRAETLSREMGWVVEPGFETFVTRAREGMTDEHIWTYIRKDGSRFPVQLSVTPLLDANNRLTGFVGIGKDLTAQREAEAALEASEQRAQTIADNIPALVAYIDLEERYRFVNARMARALDLAPEAILGRTIREIRGESAYATIAEKISAPLSGRAITYEGKGPGTEHLQDYRFSHYPDVHPSGTVHGFYALAFDISDLKRAEAELQRLARFDSLTGLANRTRLHERLGEAIARSERSLQFMALMFLDLDGFKSVNDRFGHRGGDLALQEFARRLQSAVRSTDTVARLAGDEFVIILESLHETEEAEGVAVKILKAMEPPFVVSGTPVALSTSIGIAARRLGETDSEALLLRADQALYRMKAEGRAGFRVDS